MAKQQVETVAEVEEIKSSFTLPRKKIMVKPITKEGKWLGKEHSGNFMYENTKMIITVPINALSGDLVDPLTDEERKFFENKKVSGLDFEVGDLSVYRKSNPSTGAYNYWHTFEYRLIKNQGVVADETVLDILDLSKPMDYIKYKVLLSNVGLGGIIAPSWDARFDQGTYRIAVVDAGYEEATKSNRLDQMSEAFAFAHKISKSHGSMFDFLNVYWLENRVAIKPSMDSTVDWLKAEITKIIDRDIESFLATIKSDYEQKLIIHNGMMCGAIRRSGTTFMLSDGVPIGNSVTDAILYFKDERNNEEKLRLLAQIDSNKREKTIKE
jgi:hypothetical protein